MSENKNNHGGRRKGAGRPTKDTVQLSLKVPTKIIDKLNEKYTVKERNILIIEKLKEL